MDGGTAVASRDRRRATFAIFGMSASTVWSSIPSKRDSSDRVDYVPALCTHRPSLLPIEWLSETSGLAVGSSQEHPTAEKLNELGHL
jgi:hypothetical protein